MNQHAPWPPRFQGREALLGLLKLLDLFRAATGRPARTPEELNAWLGSPEGKAATAYDRTPDGKIIPGPEFEDER
jgi:hypothetical protein